jgi:hypothetical protein
MELDLNAIKGAHAVCRRMGITSKSEARNRRPTLDELDKILTRFGVVEGRRTGIAPMQKIVAFAIFSTRRQEEITRILWRDLEPGRVLVRDMKHPGDKIGNDIWCDLVPEAEKVIASMPRVAPEIFPVGTDAISAAFAPASSCRSRTCISTICATTASPPLRDGLEHPQGVCSLRPPLMAIAETLHPPPADRRQVRGLEVARGDHMNIWFTSDHLCVPKTQGNEPRLTSHWPGKAQERPSARLVVLLVLPIATALQAARRPISVGDWGHRRGFRGAG